MAVVLLSYTTQAYGHLVTLLKVIQKAVEVILVVRMGEIQLQEQTTNV